MAGSPSGWPRTLLAVDWQGAEMGPHELEKGLIPWDEKVYLPTNEYQKNMPFMDW